MPGMGDPRFERSVIYLYAHDEEGSMGFIVNHPTEGLTLGEIATNLPENVSNTGLANLPVFIGGPVQPENGFVLYTEDDAPAEDGPAIGVTQGLDILIKAAKGIGPDHMRLVLGYAGWGPGQLENEIQDNAWLICAGGSEDVFDPQPEALYERLVNRLGVDLAMLSQSGGEA